MIRFEIVFLCINIVYAAHFNGGTITWKPIDRYQYGTSVTISIQQTYWWIYPGVECAPNVPSSTPGRNTEVWQLICTADCSTDGNYSVSPINSSTDCIHANPGLGMMTSQRTINKTLTNDTHFYLTFAGNAWVALNSPAKYGSQWSITTFIDLRMRPDGFINTPPVASVVSPQYVIVNKQTEIPISVSDADAGDFVRCRWSTYTNGYRRRRETVDKLFKEASIVVETGLLPKEQPILIRKKRSCFSRSCGWYCNYYCRCDCSSCQGTTCTGDRCSDSRGCDAATKTTIIDTTATMKSTSSFPTRQAIDECGDVCFPNSLPNGTTLSNCTISTKGLVADTWYAVAVQVEDFINESNTTAMSSVPVQFLIYVMPEPDCAHPPEFIPLTRCFEVTVGVTLIFNLSALNKCNQTDYEMADIIITKSIVGLNRSDMAIDSNNNTLAYVTIVWTPTIDQVGLQQLCAVAYSDAQIPSDEYCLTFNVITTFDVCRTTTTSTTTSTQTTTSTTSTTTEVTTSSLGKGPSWGLIGGIVASALPLALCSFCCLYRYLWSPAARRRREEEQNSENQIKYNHAQSKMLDSSQTTCDSVESNQIRRPSKSYQVYDISSESNPVNKRSSLMKSRSSVLVSLYTSNLINRQMDQSTSLSVEPSIEMNAIRARANTRDAAMHAKSSPIDTVSDVEELDDTVSTSLNTLSTSSVHEGLFTKYKLQEQNRARLSETNIK